MVNEEYVKTLEETNQKLMEKLADHDLILDILKSRVKVLRSDLFNQIDPYHLCNYLEKHGWTMKYEAQHERYLTRSYQSPKKDCKVKVHLKDTMKEARERSDVSKKIRICIEIFSHLSNKGILEVVFDILRETI